MRRFAGLFLAACMAVAVPAATVCYAEEVSTESVEETGESVEEESASENPENSSELNIAQSLDGVTLPANAEQITYTYHGNVCTAAKTATGLYLLPVVQDDGSVMWYVYNEDLDEAIPYVDFNGESISYAIILPGSDVTIPSGYERVNINLAGRTLPAWFNSAAGDSDMYLIYAMDSNGNEGFYRFDGTTGNCLRFVVDPDVELQASADSLSEELSGLKADYESMSAQDSEEIARLNSAASLQQQNYTNLQERVKKYGLIGVIALGAVTFLMLVFFIRMISKSSKLKKTKKKLAEAETAAKNAARVQQVRQRNTDPSARRPRRQELGDTRMTEGREEGTSRVRRVQKSADRGFEQSTTTSKVVRVPKEQPKEQSAQSTQGSRPVRQQTTARPTGQARPAQTQNRPVRKQESAAPRQQRPAKPAASRPMDETKIFDKAPAENASRMQVRDLDGLDDVTKSTAPAKPAVEASDIDKISEQLNSLHAVEASPVEDDFIEVESSVPEELYADSSDDDDDDFSLTDFKDI